MSNTQKGFGLEEVVRHYFDRQGFFALRGVSLRFDSEEVTDIDVWLYSRQTASVRTRSIVDVKDKRSPKAFERVLWARGMQLALGADRAIVATTDTNPKVAQFAQQQRVSLLTKEFLDRLQKGLPSDDRLSVEQFMQKITFFTNHKHDGDWIKQLQDAKSAVISLPGYQAFNRAISSFKFFAERTETRPQFKEAALRGAYFSAALACIALDSALERSLYEDAKTRYSSIENGVIYGDAGDARLQANINTVLSIMEQGIENGRSVARRTRGAINDLFGQIRAEIIAEFFARDHNAAQLFLVARELDRHAHLTDRNGIQQVSTEAKAILGVFADFVQVKRGPLLNGGYPKIPVETEAPDDAHRVEKTEPQQDKLL